MRIVEIAFLILHSQEKADVESSKELSRLRQLLRTKEECIDVLEVKNEKLRGRGAGGVGVWVCHRTHDR